MAHIYYLIILFMQRFILQNKGEKKSGKFIAIQSEQKQITIVPDTPNSLFSPALLTEHNQDWFDFFRISEKLNCETVGIKG